MRAALLAPALLLLLVRPVPASALDEKILTIPSRPGVTESYVLIRPAEAPVASVILFMGGRGALGLSRGPLGPRNTNFLVRTRQGFASSICKCCQRVSQKRSIRGHAVHCRLRALSYGHQCS